ncbi:MAG: orotidine-5'-phosphate decarboxylase [Polyangiaceae bacterium]
METRDRIALALDVETLREAEVLASRVERFVGVLKVGLELFVRHGPDAVKAFAENGWSVFLDLKLHDIPETVERAVRSAATLGARYLTLHASGGGRMLAAASRAAEGTSLRLLAVSVLTSHDAADVHEIGWSRSPGEQALAFADLAFARGVRGIVASPSEAGDLRARFGADLWIVTPGVRPAGVAAGDQRRIATPGAAIRSGADLLVVGRPIRDAADPSEAARAIHDEVAMAMESRA